MQTSLCLFLCLAISGCGGLLPQREEPVGSCAPGSDCTPIGQACQGDECPACVAHSDCASQICDVYGDNGAVGKCVATSNIIYVDSTGSEGPNCGRATGSQSLPWCSLLEGIVQLKQKPGLLISLHSSPNTYQLPVMDKRSGAVVMIGPGIHTAGKAASLASASDDAWLRLSDNANVVIDGVAINVDRIDTSQGTKVTIRRSVISYLQFGAGFDDSTVTLDRDQFLLSRLGLTFNASTVKLTNTFIAGNTADPSTNLINFNGGSGLFQFNTIANNSLNSASSLVLSCVNAASLAVKNSIFVQPGGGLQVAAGCPAIANSLVVGKSDPAATQVQQDPYFEDAGLFDLRLRKGDPINMQYLFDKAVQVNPASETNTDHDYYGTPRPQGTGYDIGAFELPVH